ncbi:MAG: PH domain-containing protein [Parcubacteria group bacterium]|nr:PH domain-containing protein [Parcubacteria group bacterium]
MDIRRIVRNLKDEEEVRGTFHQLWLALFWHWLGGLIFFFAPFFFLYLFLRWGMVGTMLLLALFFIGFLWLVRTYRVWRYTMLVLTNERLVIVSQLGFFDRSVSRIDIDKVNDVSYRKRGIFQTLFNYGSVTIQQSGLEKIALSRLHHPSLIQQAVFDVQEERSSREVAEYSEAELLAIIREIRSKVGEKRWSRILEGDWDVKQELIDEVKSQDTGKARAIEQFFSREI